MAALRRRYGLSLVYSMARTARVRERGGAVSRTRSSTGAMVAHSLHRRAASSAGSSAGCRDRGFPRGTISARPVGVFVVTNRRADHRKRAEHSSAIRLRCEPMTWVSIAVGWRAGCVAARPYSSCRTRIVGQGPASALRWCRVSSPRRGDSVVRTESHCWRVPSVADTDAGVRLHTFELPAAVEWRNPLARV